LGVTRDIRVIPNFLDCSRNRRTENPELRARFAPEHQKLLVHVSNFRPVKRAKAVIEIFARVRQAVPARLLMVGDGPDLHDAVCLARTLGVADDVEFLGEQDQVVPILSVSDAFVLPSSQESFGLAALEAMSCEVPIIASRVGGLPELVDDGVNGFLHDPGDLDGMARSALRLLTDEDLHRSASAAARRAAKDKYCDSKIVPVYEAYYSEIVEAAGSGP